MTFGDITSASVFTFTDNCSLLASSGNVANQPPGLTDSPLYFDSPAAISSFDGVPARCDIVDNALRCTVEAANAFYVCDGDAFLQINDRVPSTCGAPVLRPVFR